MDEILRAKIEAKLTAYLNRSPSSDEVVNAQNDSNIMHWIAQDDAVEQKAIVEATAIAAGVDIEAVKLSISSGVIIK